MEKQKKKNNGGSNQNQKTKPIQEHFNPESGQPSAKKAKKAHDTEIEVSKKSEESTDDEISSTIMTSEPDKNIDVEYSSPTNIPQNQKLIEKQALEHINDKQQKNEYVSDNTVVKNELAGSELTSITDVDSIDMMNIPVDIEDENVKDIKYR